MKHLFTSHESIQLENGNVKKAIERHFNWWCQPVTTDTTTNKSHRDWTYQVGSKVTIPKPEYGEIFDFQAAVTTMNIVDGTQTIRKFVGRGKCLQPYLKYERKNISFDTYIRIEYQLESSINSKNETTLWELAPYEVILTPKEQEELEEELKRLEKSYNVTAWHAQPSG